MSAIAPLMAQAQWMAKQQGSVSAVSRGWRPKADEDLLRQPQQSIARVNSLPLQPLESINYRALLEHDTDIDDEVSSSALARRSLGGFES